MLIHPCPAVKSAVKNHYKAESSFFCRVDDGDHLVIFSLQILLVGLDPGARDRAYVRGLFVFCGGLAMHLIYFDETGNTGNNLTDLQQPVFLLCAMLVHKDRWQELEHSLKTCSALIGNKVEEDGFEIHASHIRNGSGPFRGLSVQDRVMFRDALLQAGIDSDVKLIYRSIEKKRYRDWMVHTFGSGITINPHVVAFALVAQVVNQYLKEQNSLGIFISDENKEIMADVEKSIKLLRGHASTLKLDRVIEKGFFIDSRASLVLQLCDLCAYSLRKKEEQAIGMASRQIDESGIRMVDRITHVGEEPFEDVLDWIKKGAARE
jgi:hypothetical protein